MIKSNDMRFPEAGWRFRPMKTSDIARCLEIIGLCDEDDREWASETYQRRGVNNQFVATKDKVVQAVTGYLPDDGTIGSAWLSWTYLHPEFRKRGIGSATLNCLVERLEKNSFRKLFVSVSDFNEAGDELYSDALRMYKGAGFAVEIQHENYYTVGESQLILGRQLNPKKPSLKPSPTADKTVDNIQLLDSFLIDETEDAYAVDWEFVSGQGGLSVDEIKAFVQQQAQSKNIRSLFISVPNDHSFILRNLTDAGFLNVGQLRDFFQTGVNEVHFRINF